MAAVPDALSDALSDADLDHDGTTSHEVYTACFYPDDRDAVVRSILGTCTRGGADVGEVLATIAHVEPGDSHAWFTAWRALGDRIATIAATSARHGHHVSAARAYLRAANYYAVAVNTISGTDDTSPRQRAFRAHRGAWAGFLATTHWTVEHLEIPYEQTTMPGWLFRPHDSTTRRPTLVMNNGTDQAVSGLWSRGAEAGLERGYNVLLFD